MCAVAGFDFVLVDCEHGPVDLGLLRSTPAWPSGTACGPGAGGTSEPAMVLRVLDLGAEGVVAPHVDSPEQARALVDAAHYPPLGHRGFATYGRAGRFGLVGRRAPARAARAHPGVRHDRVAAGRGNGRRHIRRAGAGRDHGRPGGSAVASGPDDLDPAVAIDRVHAALADAGALRMDIVTGTGRGGPVAARCASGGLQPHPHDDGPPGRTAARRVGAPCSTTHVGSLPRSAAVTEVIFAAERGEPVDAATFDAVLRPRSTTSVARQVAGRHRPGLRR